ncbi:MAG: argininosuccinate lyase, partial [Bacteroidota bacterium]
AHAEMLTSVGLLDASDFAGIQQVLREIHQVILDGKFVIEPGVEDVHSQLEKILVERLGEAGKKIHSGRSRNDQVLTAIKLCLRDHLGQIAVQTRGLFDRLLTLSEQHRDVLLPGYTHLQVAMPSSFGLWFGAYAESLGDDLEFLLAAYNICNKNPLGSGAGYGTSFPLDRELTTRLLGFEHPNVNVVYAQMTRGKSEKTAATAIAAIGATLSKLAMDCCLYLSQNFGFISFPDELTTGSSIMPHKKNPDVFELIRGKCNRLQALPTELGFLTTNLPSGYHREMQLTKDCILPALQTIQDCIRMTTYMLSNISVKQNLLADDKYLYVFSVEAVNELVLQGVPFRDAYKQVGADIEKGEFSFDGTPG